MISIGGPTLAGVHDGSFVEPNSTGLFLGKSRHSLHHISGAGSIEGDPPTWQIITLFCAIFLLSFLMYQCQRIRIEGQCAKELAEHAAKNPSPPPVTSDSKPATEYHGSVMERHELDSARLEYWVKSSGMHTVQDWMEHYNEHPSGWGALLMIHGIKDISDRLRSKVSVLGLWAGLFVAGSMGALMEPPGPTMDCPRQTFKCEIVKRSFLYGLILGLVAHILTILLGMSFVNALNETARDADVIRMFARGQGFLATWKCECAFFIGVFCNIISVLAVLVSYLGVEALALLCICIPIAVAMYTSSSTLLYRNGSIVYYWRTQAPASDPYNLGVPLFRVKQRAKHAVDLHDHSIKHLALDSPHKQGENDRHSGFMNRASSALTSIAHHF